VDPKVAENTNILALNNLPPDKNKSSMITQPNMTKVNNRIVKMPPELPSKRNPTMQSHEIKKTDLKDLQLSSKAKELNSDASIVYSLKADKSETRNNNSKGNVFESLFQLSADDNAE
tara:strand:- start:625 stop:975 length:351 start_codon:yes stop_codon:yes gene_type:complete